MTNKQKLYEITKGDEVLYGYKLATNSKSLYVMEILGTGEVVSVEPWQVTEVLPYTIEVSYGDNYAHTYSYTAKKGEYEVGDVLVIHGAATNGWCIVRVEAVDTKSKAASKEIKPIAVIKGVK